MSDSISTIPLTAQAWESSFDRLAEQVWSMMNEMERKNYFRSHAPKAWQPRVNLYETADRYIVCVELAGMQSDDIDARAYDGHLHIRGARPKPSCADKPENVSVHLMEIDSGRFHRKVPIPRDAAVERITAHYRLGYLWITIPRSASPADR